MHPTRKVAHIKVVETKSACRPLGVITVTSSTLVFANFFMGCIPLHTQELFSKRIIIFHHAIVSEVRILHPWDPYFIIPSKLNQIIIFKVGRISTRRDNSNAPKIIVVRSVDLEILHLEL
jgi:hypothetical protein